MVRVPHPELSLWQSAVREVVARHVAGGDVAAAAVHEHPLAQAADIAAYDHHRAARAGAAPRHPGWLAEILDRAHHVRALGVVTELASIVAGVPAYSDRDPGFLIECIPRFIEHYLEGQPPQYRDWKVQGRGNIDFGVVDYPLPAK